MTVIGVGSRESKGGERDRKSQKGRAGKTIRSCFDVFLVKGN
jgi:hypothetical protein